MHQHEEELSAAWAELAHLRTTASASAEAAWAHRFRAFAQHFSSLFHVFSSFSWFFRGLRLIFVLLQGLSQLRRSSAEREQANALVAARLEQAYASHGQLESEFLALSRRQECSQEDLRKADSTAEALRSRCAGAQS